MKEFWQSYRHEFSGPVFLEHSVRTLVLVIVSLYSKFEVLSFIHSEDVVGPRN